MSQRNVEIVRSIYTAWERGDFSSAGWAHPEIEMVAVDSIDGGTWTGVARIGQAWQAWLDLWAEYHVEVEELRALDDERVLVLVLHCGRGRGSGFDVAKLGRTAKRAGANVVHLRDGRVTRLALYWDRERALADLGIPE